MPGCGPQTDNGTGTGSGVVVFRGTSRATGRGRELGYESGEVAGNRPGACMNWHLSP